jgi:signal transduction histidine kinase
MDKSTIKLCEELIKINIQQESYRSFVYVIQKINPEVDFLKPLIKIHEGINPNVIKNLIDNITKYSTNLNETVEVILNNAFYISTKKIKHGYKSILAIAVESKEINGNLLKSLAEKIHEYAPLIINHYQNNKATDNCISEKNLLQSINKNLKTIDRNKNYFIAHLSHELRTPLSGILLTAESLEEGVYGTLTEKQVAPIKLIEKSCNFLFSMINDLLDISRLSEGKTELDIGQFDLNKICNDAVTSTRDIFKVKSQTIISKYSNEAIIAYCDGRRIKQIIINLLSNASKFTPEGGTMSLN